jgi:hypothetical protein
VCLLRGAYRPFLTPTAHAAPRVFCITKTERERNLQLPNPEISRNTIRYNFLRLQSALATLGLPLQDRTRRSRIWSMLGRAELLSRPQTEQIFQAVVKGGFDRHDCNLENETVWARLTHKQSGSYFVIYRDPTWRFVGHYAVSDGPERLFDLSWVSVIALFGEWLADVKRDRDAMGL